MITIKCGTVTILEQNYYFAHKYMSILVISYGAVRGENRVKTKSSRRNIPYKIQINKPKKVKNYDFFFVKPTDTYISINIVIIIN